MWLFNRRLIATVIVSCCLTAVGLAQDLDTQSTETPELPEHLPLFPLQDVMLFPGVARPLHIFEPRYREMLLDALASHRMIGMVMLTPGHEEDYFGNPPIETIGCAGYLDRVDGLPDGRYNIVIRGVSKFRIESEDRKLSFRTAKVTALAEDTTDEQDTKLGRLRPELEEILDGILKARQGSRPEPLSTPRLVNFLAQILPMDPAERYKLLTLSDPLARAQAILRDFGSTALE